jgi:RND family efflux transporter MFP subunit
MKTLHGTFLIIPRTAMLLMLTLVFSGCSKDEPEEAEEPVRPVKTILIESMGLENTRSFPGIVDASQKAEMSFRVSGKLNELPVKEGQKITQGDVIAQLDDTDFNIALKDSLASHDRAKADFKRAKKLLPEGHISRSDYDKLEAQSKTTTAQLAQAKQNLAYTTLKASFSGVVAKRYVQNFEEVSAKQKIVLLHDVSSLEISIDVPESLMILIDRNRRSGDSKRNVVAEFKAIEGKQFPLTFKEVATAADEVNQTFRVTFTMEPPEGFNILPGMITTVIADSSDLESSDKAILLPVSAVVSNTSKQATIWLVNEENMTVFPQVVQAGMMQKDQIEVTGLKPGNRIVVTGVPFLREGMKVSLLETGEQPE